MSDDDWTKTGSDWEPPEDDTPAWAARFAAVMLLVIMVWVAAIIHLACKI